ncbi:MAG TPA: N-acetyltransferase [Methanoregulaceae archaeon]|nr:N-acetyltransferase [Methanoregulaceae archaeon]
MDCIVRPYRDEDFSGVWAMERNGCEAGYPSAVVVRQAAELFPRTFLVAADDTGPAGYVIAAPSSDPSVGWILRLRVREDRRRMGYGRALLREAIARLGDGGAACVRLTVSPRNEPALALYRGLGFIEVDRLPDYFGPGEDRLLLSFRIP